MFIAQRSDASRPTRIPVVMGLIFASIASWFPPSSAAELLGPSPFSFEIGDAPLCATVADLNGDGALDLVVGTQHASPYSLRVWLGDGLGGFAQFSDLDLGSEVNSIVVADFNGDGAPDLAAASYAKIAVLLGDGFGRFERSEDVTAVAGIDSLSAADFNGDGIADLAAGNYSGVAILVSDGSGGFTQTATLAVNNGRGTVVGDFNRDGAVDVARGGGSVNVFLGDGLAQFGPATEFAIAGQLATGGDFNGDGLFDLTLLKFGNYPDPGSVMVLAGNGLGGFTLTAELEVPYGPFAAVAVDLNRDHADDLVVAIREIAEEGIPGSALLFLGDGLGGFQRTADITVDARAFAAGDLNADGAADLVVADESGNGTVTVRLGDGLGGIARAASVEVGTTPWSVVAARFNGDDADDLAVANASSDTVSILLGDGLGGFVRTDDIAVGAFPRALAVGDFNEDADEDLVVLDGSSASVSVLLGNGLGGFTRAPDVPVGPGPQAVSVADFNGDGAPDLVVSCLDAYNDFSSSLSILMGDGLGGFVETIHLDGSGPFAHTIADFNGDGFPDLAIANSGTYPDYQANVAVLLGDGLGGLEGATGLGAGGADMALVATDLNGDGHADLVVANGGTGEVRSFLGDGTGRLMPAGAIQQGFLGLVAADFNGDGVPDLAATIYFADSVNVLLGDGHGGFTPAADLEVGKSPRELAVGDFDRDGRADLAVASSRSSAVNIMFSQLEQRADTNGSNRIDGFDIAAIARLAGVQRGDVAYRRNADVDLNGVIDGDDLALCAHRMGKLNRGASPLRPRLQQAIPPVSNTVTLQPLASDGDLLTVSVMVSDADDLVAGADFAVAFDPTPSDGGNGQVLEYVGFTPGTFLSGGAGQAYSVESTTPGRVDVAVSRLPNEDRPGGPPRPLMNLLFRARRTGQADLTFGPRQQSGPSLLNAAGQDVPGVRFVSESIVQVDASGGGAPGQKIAYAPDVLDFGDPALGTAVKKVLRLSNFGFSELRVTSVASTLPEFSTYFTCDSAGQETSCPSVPPYGFVELPVVFSTARAGVLAATLVIDSDDPQQPEIYVPLVGRSSLPVSVTPQHLDFGRVTNGQATTAKVRITNRGGNPLVLTGYESSDAAFIAQPEFSTLATGEAGDIEVTFQPTSATEHRAVITLGFDAPAEKVAMVSVVGIGDAVRTMASRSSARSRAPLEAPSPTPPR